MIVIVSATFSSAVVIQGPADIADRDPAVWLAAFNEARAHIREIRRAAAVAAVPSTK